MNKFKVEISYLKDFLLWNPELLIKKNDEHISKIETFLKALEEFQDVVKNENIIIKLYTMENGSYYKDFNYWLNNLDLLAIQKKKIKVSKKMV